MKSIRVVGLALAASALLAASLAWSQGGNPPASTKESGQTSGHGMTAAEQTAKGEGGNAAQQAVEKLDDELFDAGKRGDASVFEKNLADNYLRIDANGQIRNKAETVDMYKSGLRKLDAIDLKDRKIRIFGNTAISTREDNVKGHVGPTDISGTYRETVVYVKGKNGQWQDVYFQSTKVQP
jgi:ketosteroid isomerase-like protein